MVVAVNTVVVCCCRLLDAREWSVDTSLNALNIKSFSSHVELVAVVQKSGLCLNLHSVMDHREVFHFYHLQDLDIVYVY